MTFLSSEISAYLLKRACSHMKVPTHAYDIKVIGKKSNAGPPALIIQPGGMDAMQKMGLDNRALGRAGNEVSKSIILDKNLRELFSMDFTKLGYGSGLAICTKSLLTKIRYEEAQMEVAHEKNSGFWEQVDTPPVFIRMAKANLKSKNLGIIWDSSNFHVGMVQVTPNELLIYVVPKSESANSDSCSSFVDTLPNSLERFISLYDSKSNNDLWFPRIHVGLRYPLAKGGEILWGSESLRLHPLTGQNLSYWAKQSNKVAALLKQNISAQVIASELHTNNIRMYRHYEGIMKFYLSKKYFWRLFRYPFILGFNNAEFIQRAAIRQLTLT